MKASNRRGFTLVETIVATAVLTTLFLGVSIIVQIAIRSIGDARLRGEATQLAEERLEMAHNLPYESVGTVGGIPAGSLTALENVTVNGMQFSVTTAVLYIDDAFDGVAPADLLAADYKRVRVSVTWGGAFPSKTPVVLMTDIAPKGLETTIGGGTLSILVFDSQGQPVPNATVHIEASSLTPAISMDALTDIYGRVLLPGAPICTSCYKISATKSGYTTDRTYDTSEVANPYKPHVSVLQSRVSEVSFAIDKTATLVLKATRSASYSYSPFAGVQMVLRGTKEIGRTVDDDPVYKIDLKPVTSSNGTVTVSNLEWDSYSISLPSNASVDYAGSWPFSPISLNPGDTATFTMLVEPSSENSLLVQVEDAMSQALSGVTIMLTKDAYTAVATTGAQTTGDLGQAFFPGLTNGLYTLALNLTGFETATASVTVSGDAHELFKLATPSASPTP
jgi:prepilin-type N-terminal cleavage/methylation domain-containing protein